MAKYKTSGQKRKGAVRVIAIVVFLVLTFGAATLLGKIQTVTLAWVKNHASISATVTELSSETEEYRTLKGRKREREVYYVTYAFELDSEEYGNTTTITEEQYSSLSEGAAIEVWYASDDPYTNETKDNMEAEIASDNTFGHAFGVLPFTAPATYFIYLILTLLFVRESKKAMPKGFYTSNSWLDVDDHYVVAIVGEDLMYFSFDKSRTREVQTAYQKNTPLKELIQLSKTTEVTRFPLSEITLLESNHNSDTFTVEHKQTSHTIEFLNQTVKAHALNAVKKHLPSSLNYQKLERTRLQATLPALIFLSVLIAAAYFIGSFLISLIIGFISLVWVVPGIYRGVRDPKVTEYWRSEEIVNEEVQQSA